MRVFARRERPHPGAQLSLFEAGDGWRYSLWVTNRPPHTRGWLGQNACIDAAHRVHARVEDAIRTGKDCGIGKFPSGSLAMNKAWQAAALTAATLLAWLRPAPARPGRPPGQGRAEDAALPHLARHRPPGPQRPPALSQVRRCLAVDTGDRSRLETRQLPRPGTLTSPRHIPAAKHGTGARGTPGRPARQPGPCHTRTPKSRSTTRPDGQSRPATSQRE